MLFRRFEQAYADLELEDIRDISEETGCYKPCKYRHYRLVGHPKGKPKPDNFESPRNFGLMAFTRYTTVSTKINNTHVVQHVSIKCMNTYILRLKLRC